MATLSLQNVSGPVYIDLFPIRAFVHTGTLTIKFQYYNKIYDVLMDYNINMSYGTLRSCTKNVTSGLD